MKYAEPIQQLSMGNTYLLSEIQPFLAGKSTIYTNCFAVWQFLMNKVHTKEIPTTVFIPLKLLNKLLL